MYRPVPFGGVERQRRKRRDIAVGRYGRFADQKSSGRYGRPAERLEGTPERRFATSFPHRYYGEWTADTRERRYDIQRQIV